MLAGGAALACGFLVFVGMLDREEARDVPHAQGAVALTGGVDRISDAVDLVANGHADQLLISGVNQTTSRAQLARRNPRFRPLYNCCIELGYDALNTMGNAAETQRWARAHHVTESLIVVTSNYHMPRALLEIGRALPGVKLVPYNVVTSRAQQLWTDPSMARVVAVEYLKFVAALVRPVMAVPNRPAKAAPFAETGGRHAALVTK